MKLIIKESVDEILQKAFDDYDGSRDQKVKDCIVDISAQVEFNLPAIEINELPGIATWIGEPSGGFTPGGNPVYHCSHCGYIYGSHELYPSAKYCRECGRRMVNTEGDK